MIASRGVRAFRFLNGLFFVLLAIIMLFPFYTTLMNSIAPPIDYVRNDIIVFPSKVDISTYRIIMGPHFGLVQAYRVNVIVTVLGTVASMIVTSLASYALSQKTLPFRSAITLFFVLTIYFSGGMIPTYLTVRAVGLLDTLAALILPGLVGTGIMLLLRNFFMKIPRELVEAARIDGCSELRAIPLIIVPLSLPAIATFTLFYTVNYWNVFMPGVLYISSPDKLPLQVFLRMIIWDATARAQQELEKILQEGQMPPTEAFKAAAIMATTIPIIFVYPFLQRYFIKGITVGSLKG